MPTILARRRGLWARSDFGGPGARSCSAQRTSRSFGVEGDASSRGFAINLGVWVSSLSPRERAQAGHSCPAYASRYPCSFMNYKQGSGGWALLASAQSLSAESELSYIIFRAAGRPAENAENGIDVIDGRRQRKLSGGNNPPSYGEIPPHAIVLCAGPGFLLNLAC